MQQIQVSQECADLLVAGGKEGWLVPRKNPIRAKGKGELKTYFLKIDAGACGSHGGHAQHEHNHTPKPRPSQCIIPDDKDRLAIPHDSKAGRLVSWNVEILSQLIKKIVAGHAAVAVEKPYETAAFKIHSSERMPLDEMATIICMPELDATAIGRQVDPESITLDEEVRAQLIDLVAQIAAGYHDNPFHSFEQ